jgi:hypothetical protein
MRAAKFVRAAFVCIGGLYGFVGCSNPSEDASDDSSAESLSSYSSIAIFGTFSEVGGQPAAGVSICLENFPTVPCVTTAADGSYRLTGVPKARDVEVTAFRWGNVPMNMLFKSNEDFAYHQTMVTSGSLDAWTAIAGGTTSEWTGTISAATYVLNGGQFPANNDDLSAGTTGLAGFSFGITIPQVAAPSAVVSYLSAAGVPDPALTATTSTGYMGFVGANADQYYEVHATQAPAGYKCNHDFLQKGLTPGSVKVRVRRGFITGFWAPCVPKP